MNKPTVLSPGIVDVDFGVGVRIINPVNLYSCRIGDGVFIGPFVEIQRQTSIGSRTKIQSHTFICEMVTIGNDCFIGHGVVFINDPFSGGGPAQGNKLLWKPTQIGDNVSIGSNATIMPISICSGAVVGAGSVVVKDITVPGIYAGNPAKFIGKVQ